MIGGQQDGSTLSVRERAASSSHVCTIMRARPRSRLVHHLLLLVAGGAAEARVKFVQQLAGGASEAGAALGGAFLLQRFVLDARYIPSESMLPTYAVGDLLMLDKVCLRLRAPERGDVVCFRPPPALVEAMPTLVRGDVCCIKRVVAVAGDEVSVRRGRLHVNGRTQDEPYVAERRIRYRMARQRVPPGHVFVLGDNRNWSYDSHCWGSLPQNLLLGVPLCTYWPPRRFRLRQMRRPFERQQHCEFDRVPVS